MKKFKVACCVVVLGLMSGLVGRNAMGQAPGMEGVEGVEVGKVLYQSKMESKANVKGWVMEGPGRVDFAEGWMYMESPFEKMHHVFWCPKDLPGSYVAQWEMQNLNLKAGLCIVFFSATGLDGGDVLDGKLPARDGTFSQYNKGAMKNYHISYYANTPNKPDREMARLRKNPGANIVEEGPRGIEVSSDRVHKVTLIKEGARVRLLVDGRKIIDWTDDGKVNGEVLGGGKIGLRQMQWTRFRYRNFKVWAVK